MDLLRFSTAGSVDDGKSTLIGRLLYDTKGAYEDQLASIQKNGAIDLSLLTDGLRAEREQGITIDVAYRYFATPRRKFIIADTPGHEQYTRNMATGASTAELTIILIDARKGVLPQSRRHATIASLLGIPQVVVAVNKMDLMDFSEEVFLEIQRDFTNFARDLGFEQIRFIPISALDGDNIVSPSPRTPWFRGGSLLELLETVDAAKPADAGPFRLPVQYVIRPTLDFRGYAGQIAGGAVRPGDEVLVLPSGRRSTVTSLASFDGDLTEAFAPMSTTITLADEIDISRGDMLVNPSSPPQVGNRLEASLVWMDAQPLRLGRPYLVKHTSRQIRGTVTAIRHKVNINTQEAVEATELELNEIAVITLETQNAIFFDPYRESRALGSFILIDTVSNATVAAGMIRGLAPDDVRRHRVTTAERAERHGHKASIIVVPEEGEFAWELERALFDRGHHVAVTDHVDRAEALSQAGLIAILRDKYAVGNKTVEEVCRSLEDEGAIPGAVFSIGEGI